MDHAKHLGGEEPPHPLGSELTEPARALVRKLKQRWICDYDETQSIGKRYRRQDELGTPLCVTFDFDSLNDNAVTIRDRDSMEQERVSIDDLEQVIAARLGF